MPNHYSDLSPPVTPASSRMTAIESTRGFAALLVVLVHASFFCSRLGPEPFGGIFRGGSIGVDFFFTLSGFVICHSNLHRADDIRGLGHYFKRRWIRIYPTYWLSIVVYLVPYLVLRHAGINMRNDWSFTTGQFLWGWFLLPQKGFPLVAVAWSLQYEEYFYFLFALFLVRRGLGATVFVLWGLGIAILNSAGYIDANGTPWWPSFVFGPCNSAFLFGVVLAYELRMRPALASRFDRAHLACVVIGSVVVRSWRWPAPFIWARALSC
jgi:exopolysaccharide production protein ExoZ